MKGGDASVGIVEPANNHDNDRGEPMEVDVSFEDVETKDPNKDDENNPTIAVADFPDTAAAIVEGNDVVCCNEKIPVATNENNGIIEMDEICKPKNVDVIEPMNKSAADEIVRVASGTGGTRTDGTDATGGANDKKAEFNLKTNIKLYSRFDPFKRAINIPFALNGRVGRARSNSLSLARRPSLSAIIEE